MSKEQSEVSRGKLNDDCSENATKDSLGRHDNIRGCLSHTWQTQKSCCTSNCLQSYECDCDELKLTKVGKPTTIQANSSLRAVAQYCFDDTKPYDYEIIDIQTSKDTGHIMHPPDPCVKYNRQDQQPR